MSKLPIRLKILRDERNLSLRQLSKLTGASPSALHSYETGERRPKYETLEALCDVFNVDMDYLLGKTDIRNRAANELGYDSLAEAFHANGGLQSFSSPPQKTSYGAKGEIEGEIIALCKKMSIQQKNKLLTYAYELVDGMEEER